MRLTLHGIPTAMEIEDYTGLDGIRLGRTTSCPCGWALTSYDSRGTDQEGLAALRFHYEHCPQAKVVDPQPTINVWLPNTVNPDDPPLQRMIRFHEPTRVEGWVRATLTYEVPDE